MLWGGGGGGGGGGGLLDIIVRSCALQVHVHYSYMYMHVLYSLGEALSLHKVQVFGLIYQALIYPHAFTFVGLSDINT